MEVCKFVQYESVQICTIWKCANLYNMEVCKFVQYESVQICTIWKCANLYNMKVCKFVQYGSVQICKNNQYVTLVTYLLPPDLFLYWKTLENPGS